jgi:tetratricopeptide (TPR) repeat protein
MTQEKEKAISALVAAFPSSETWIMFYQNKDNSLIVDTVIQYAARCGLIKSADPEKFETLLQQNFRPSVFKPPRHMELEELLEKKEDLLKIHLSLRALTVRINSLLSEKQIALPKVTNSMLTRLKREPVDTAYKQNVLRSLAFWIGHERPDIATDWHYDTLLAICREGRQTENFQEGARIGFALYSRGDVIDHEILGWLKKTVKSYIDQSIGHFSYGRWGKVRAYDITTLYVDFPKETPSNNLIQYQQCLRSATSLAHQMAIRWALSPYSTKNRFLSIAIVVGEYTNLDNHLLPLLNAKLPDDLVIRISDMARQCVLINDIRVVLCPEPTETTLFNGESFAIWWIEAFWSTLYFDFVSELLADPILQNQPASIEKLNQLLWRLPDQDGKDDAEDEANAVTAFFKFPQNSLLGLEIAKTLYYRRRFNEALEILRVVLSINPTDLIARTLRMILLRNMALDAPTFNAAGGLFRQAMNEARFIETNCSCESEDFYCEYAVLHMAQAMRTLRHSRSDPGIAKDQERILALKNSVHASLAAAQDLFENGIAVSPSAIRSAYLLGSVRLLTAILKEDEDIFINPLKSLACRHHIADDVSVNLHWQIGFRRPDVTGDRQGEITEQLLMVKAKTHDDAITLQSYRPTIYFCHAVALTDLNPLPTVTALKRAQQALLIAREIAESVKKVNVCIYSFTRTYGEMIPADEFIGHINNCLRFIEETVKDEAAGQKGKRSGASGKKVTPGLMTLNF